jgi:hypothetical protein
MARASAVPGGAACGHDGWSSATQWVIAYMMWFRKRRDAKAEKASG